MQASSRSCAFTHAQRRSVRGVLGVAALGIATAVSSLATGCATAHTSFAPYSTTSVRPRVVTRAVEVSERDFPALAMAGAVIVGTVTSRGNGFASAEHVRVTLADEAARHGGTHVVFGMSLQKSARGQRVQSSSSATSQAASASYHPGATVELTGLVLRLPDDTSWTALPPPLRPARDALVVRDAAKVTAEPVVAVAETGSGTRVAHVDPQPESRTKAAGETILIDGSHIKPLPPGSPQ
jgi:hypothetical protein